MIDEDRFQNCVRDFSSSVSVQTGLKHSGWVSLVIHCSAGMRRIRSILEVEQLGPFIPGKKRRVHNKTPTSPYKRHNSSEIRRDLAKRKTGVKGYFIYVGSYLISDKMRRLYGKVGVLFLPL